MIYIYMLSFLKLAKVTFKPLNIEGILFRQVTLILLYSGLHNKT